MLVCVSLVVYEVTFIALHCEVRDDISNRMNFSLIHYYELSPSNEQKLINQSLRGVINKRLFDEHNKYSPEQRHNYTHTFTRMRDQNEEREAKLSKLGCFSI